MTEQNCPYIPGTSSSLGLCTFTAQPAVDSLPQFSVLACSSARDQGLGVSPGLYWACAVRSVCVWGGRRPPASQSGLLSQLSLEVHLLRACFLPQLLSTASGSVSIKLWPLIFLNKRLQRNECSFSWALTRVRGRQTWKWGVRDHHAGRAMPALWERGLAAPSSSATSSSCHAVTRQGLCGDGLGRWEQGILKATELTVLTRILLLLLNKHFSFQVFG